MAALHPPPTSSNRMGTVSFLPNLTSSTRYSLCFPIHLQYPSYDVKLYRVPMAHLRSLLTFAKARSAIVHGTAVGNAIGSTSPLIQRPDLFLDRSSHASNNADDFEKQLQELFDEVKTLISTGKMTDAIDLLQANYHAVKEQLDIIALGYMAIGDLKMVGSLLKVMSKIIDSLDDDEMILDSVLIHMGSMYSAIGNFCKSISMYERALKIVDNVYGKHDIFLVTPLLGLAKVLGSNGKASEATDIYKRVITIMESSYGADSANLILPLSCLGNLLLGQGKADDAENPFSRIVSIYTTLHGEKDGRVGMALCSVANVKCAQGDADEAIRHCVPVISVIVSYIWPVMRQNALAVTYATQTLHIALRTSGGHWTLNCFVMVMTVTFLTKKHKNFSHHS